jgi:hypothetical protein
MKSVGVAQGQPYSAQIAVWGRLVYQFLRCKSRVNNGCFAELGGFHSNVPKGWRKRQSAFQKPFDVF